MTAIDLRLGRYQDVLADVECDALIVDPPYGERTHAKQDHGRHQSQNRAHWITRRGLGYDAWTPEHVAEFVASWSPRTRGWFCAFTSHDLVPAWERALGDAGRYVFAPLACVQRGMNVRLAGDGPSNWTVWLVVTRPRSRTWATWGTLPGAYVGSAVDDGETLADKARRTVAGGKPLWLMRALVRDYSRPGDLVCDPCAGGGTTALACHAEGRRFVGAECDPATYAKAAQRIADTLAQQPLPLAVAREARQLALGGDGER